MDSLKKDHEVVSLIHNYPTGRFQKEALEGTIRVRGDVRDYRTMKRIITRFNVDKIYHFAALAKVKSAYKDPLNVYDVNVMGCVSVLEAARQADVDKVLVLITDKVYGEKVRADEDSPLQASEPYATSKVAQQYIAESYAMTYDMNIVYPHSCNVFGFDPFSSRIFNNVIKKCINGENPLIFSNDKSIREYIYVKDLVPFLRTLMDGDYQGSHNISTGWVHDNEEIVLSILKNFAGLTPLYRDVKLPPQIQHQTMVSKYNNFKPAWSFEDAVEETIATYYKYKDDWRSNK